jgi:hypothetical protein
MGGKSVSEVLEHLKKKGLNGILLDDTTELTAGDVLIAGGVYKFQPSIHIPSLGL